MRKLLLLLLLFSSVPSKAQDSTNHLTMLNFITEDAWEQKGTWSNGSGFHQTFSAEWELNNRIIRMRVEGIVNMQTGERGIRNEGIFAYDAEAGIIKLYIFDIFGEITECNVEASESKITVSYDYIVNNNSNEMRDEWIKVSNDKYQYTVSIHKRGKWETLLDGNMTRIKE